MNHRISQHARKRMQQRAIQPLLITLIEEFGTRVRQKGNTEVAFVTHEMVRNLMVAVERLPGVVLVTSANGSVITAMHQTQRIKRNP